MFTIFKRELRSYFLSPLAYVYFTGFFVIFGLFFYMINIKGTSYAGISDLTYALNNMKLVILFVLPALTMKLIAEEKRSKTDQLLLTSPIKISSIVIGKYLAAVSIYFFSILISIVYPLILFCYGNPQLGKLINSYLGFVLLGCSFMAICIFMSALTDNQVVAFLLGFGTILSLWLIGYLNNNIQNEMLKKVIDWISILKRYDDFADGILKPAPIVYYLSIIGLFLFLTVRSVEKRRWSEG